MKKYLVSTKLDPNKARRAISTFSICLAALAVIAVASPAAWAQSPYHLTDYHFRAGDGGLAAKTEADSVTKPFGTDNGFYWSPDWLGGIINPDAISPTLPASAGSVAYTGTGKLGLDGGTAASNGEVGLEAGQASSSGGRGGEVIVNIEAGRVIANTTANASRYFFTAGDGANAGNVVITGTEFTLGTYSAFVLSSGADSGGGVSFSVDKLNLGSGSGASIFFRETAGGGRVESAITDLWAYRDSSVSYEGTSARYNAIENIYLRTAAKLTLYGKAGNRFNENLPGEFDQTGNYTADGARISVSNVTSPTYLNIQAGRIQATSLHFDSVAMNFALSRPYPTAALYLNYDNAFSNPNRPGLLAGESSLGKLDLSALDKNDITFNFNPTSLINTAVGETFQLIKGSMSDGTYLISQDYGTFARNMGASMYLFQLDGSSGDLLLTYLGLDGGFTHYIKSYFEGRAAEATTVIAGGQFVADSVIANARLKARLNETTTSLSVGVSKIKTNTGSYVENDNYNAALSGAYLFELGPGQMLFGAFVEAGRGRYDYWHAYNPAAPQSNDGKSDYYGGGAFVRYEFPLYGRDGFYTEASIRGGKIDNQFNGIFGNSASDYNNHSTYYGGHFGLGKVFSLTDRTGLDIYAKGFYHAVESGGVMTSTKENLDFDRIESITTRIGGRLSHQFTEQFVAYVGGSWEKEYNGRVDGTYLGKDYDFGTSLKGDSALGEIGFNLQPSYLPLEVELSAFGKGGRQEGFGGSLSLKYSY